MEVSNFFFTKKKKFSLHPSHDLFPQTAEAPSLLHSASPQQPSTSGTECHCGSEQELPLSHQGRGCAPQQGNISPACLPLSPWLTAWGSASSCRQVLLCLLLPTTHKYTHGSLMWPLASVSVRSTKQESREGQRMQQERERGCNVIRRRKKDTEQEQ